MSLNTTELLKKVRKVEIKTRGLSHRLFAGHDHSAFKGRGMSFAEVRPYAYRDDVRSIDWNVTARCREPFIKTFEEERELTVMLLIDFSRSDNFGSRNMTKADLMTEVAAVLSFSAITNNDKVGVILFTDRIEKFIPPRKGRKHILRIIRELIDRQAQGTGTDIGVGLHYLTNVIKKRCITFLLSDFLDSAYENELKVATRKHDLIGVRIYDPLETDLPDAGLICMQDIETGENVWADTSDSRTRANYRKKQRSYFDYFVNAFRKNGADYLNIRTDEPYFSALHRFFRQRETRR